MSKGKRPKDLALTPEDAAMVHEQEDAALIEHLEGDLTDRLAKLEHRLDLLYRYTVGDRTGWRYPLPSSFLKDRGDEFPPPDYDMQGGPRKPQEKT